MSLWLATSSFAATSVGASEMRSSTIRFAGSCEITDADSPRREVPSYQELHQLNHENRNKSE
jgi:hypothetical protein